MDQLRRGQQRKRNQKRGLIVGGVVVVFAVLALYSGGVFNGASKKKTVTAAAPTTLGSATTAPTTTVPTPPTAPPVSGGTKLTGATPCPKTTGTNPHVTTFAQAPPNCLQAGKTYTATFATNLGNVVVALDTTKTPLTANNFIVLARYHYFDGTAIFRTDPSIGIIQGGSPHTQSNADAGPGYTIKDEGSKYTYVPGDLTMARTSAPNSAGAQFFFCVTAACSALNSQGTYVNFAKVTSGLPVLQKILALNSGSGQLGGAPKTLVTVNTVTITES